jgi:predicted small lipoprotein YifL
MTWRSAIQMLIVTSLVLGIAACGTKSELVTPDNKRTPHGQKDPSQPPNPIGR